MASNTGYTSAFSPKMLLPVNQIALFVGVCGALPQISGRDASLGDVIIDSPMQFRHCANSNLCCNGIYLNPVSCLHKPRLVIALFQQLLGVAHPGHV